MKLPKIYLCSSSPRRQQLLQQIGVPFELLNASIDESILKNESALDYVKRVAQEKVFAGKKIALGKENLPILAGDTIVVFNNEILLKPKDKSDFVSMLSKLSNNTHSAITAISLLFNDKCQTQVVETKVTFRTISQDEMEYYWENYHPIDKSGSYGIHDFAAVFVKEIAGSYTNVVGLPLMETYQLLMNLKIN